MRRCLPLIALAALVVLFLRQAIFTNLIFARGDELLYFYPYWDYRAQSFLAGRLPLWNPYLFMGVPFLANSQAGVFYPLNWPLAFFPAPVAVKISIVAHLIIAAWGAYALARRVFELEPYPATFAAAVFALGGYLTAQAEHVNQLQGLAWMPLTLLMAYRISHMAYGVSHIANSSSLPVARHPQESMLHFSLFHSPLFHSSLFHCSLFIVSLSLQLTAGHTQTTFITLLACGAVALFNTQYRIHNTQKDISDKPYAISRRRYALLGFGALGFGIFLAFGLAAVQLIPTFELSRLSLRGGGLPLNEAVSFSLNPLLLGRALLPGYSRLIYSEFVGYIGVIPLVLALFALGDVRRNRLVLLAALIAGLGLFFALGGYNPIYLVLARFVPGFNLFRVPARWLALWALGAAMLAGFGLQTIGSRQSAIGSRKLIALSLPPLLLVSLSFLSAPITPPGELGPIGYPASLDLALWLAPLAIALCALPFTHHRSHFGIWSLGFGILSFLELLLASQSLPLNHLTTPDAYTSVRPAMTQLLAAQPADCRLPTAHCPPPARFLSLSALEFDPGDLRELRGELDPQLPPDAVYDAIVATKHKEVLSPNLPLAWGVPTVDGYDGGILPLRQYAEFAENFGPVDPNTDGRLRQTLKAIPPNWLLDLTNTRWIITDKTGDAWVDNVFYDLGFTVKVTPDQPLVIEHMPVFQATALGLVLAEDSAGGKAHISFADGSTVVIPFARVSALPAIRLHFDKPKTITALTITTDTALTVRGVSLIDERTDAFQSLTLGPYRLAHSGDVKIYENLNILPRAFVTTNPADPSLPFIIHHSAFIIKYNAERVVIQTTTTTPGYLILTDEYYPGWIATIDDQPVEIIRAYGLFRAVPLPAGTHVVEFRFEPMSFKIGLIVTLISLAVVIGLLLTQYSASYPSHSSAAALHLAIR